MTTAQHPVDTERWIYRSGESDDSPAIRLFCLPYAGGGASVYRLWPNCMPPGVELCRVQLPGRESRFREAPFTQMSQAIEPLLTVMKPLLDRPYALFGHSMGALMSFQLSHALTASGYPPAALCVSAWRPPHHSPPNPIAGLPDDALVQELQHRYGAMSRAMENPEIIEMMLPVLRADLSVVESVTYSEGQALPCPIHVFGSPEDTWVPSDQLIDWQRHGTGCDVKLFPGGHFYLNDHAESLATDVGQRTIDALNVAQGD